MDFFTKLTSGHTTLSFELFPPKNPAGWALLYSALAEVSRLCPDYISVTYGAGGSTRRKTVELTGRIFGELGIEAVAHLTCQGHSLPEIEAILASLAQAGVENILALRGDPPKGDPILPLREEPFAHASELIAFTSRNYQFRLGCACYPEKHPDAPSLEDDIRHLKEKQDAGATFAITQLFFDNDALYRFRDRATAMGIRIPIIAGIMPITSIAQLERFRSMCNATIPPALAKTIESSDDVVAGGVQYGIRQCLDLLAHDIAGLHFYTLNRSSSSSQITLALRASGHFPMPEKV